MKIDYVAVGKRIKKARKACGLTQEKLAELTGLSTAHIGKIEVATNEPSLQALVDIANALNIGVDSLLADNVNYPIVYLRKDIEELLDGVTPQELTVMIATLTTLRHSLVAARILRNEGLKD